MPRKKTKIDFKEELDSYKQREVEQCKAKCEIDPAAKERLSYNKVMILILLFLTGTMIAIVFYAIHVFLKVTRISDVAGIHVTEPFKKAAKEFTDFEDEKNIESGDYAGWKTYKDAFFEVKYPEEWELKVNGHVSLRQYNRTQGSGFDSLAMMVSFNIIQNLENMPLEKVLAANRIEPAKQYKTIKLDGKDAVRTPSKIEPSGLETTAIYYQVEGKIFSIVMTCFREHAEEVEEQAEKIIASIKFLDDVK